MLQLRSAVNVALPHPRVSTQLGVGKHLHCYLGLHVLGPPDSGKPPLPNLVDEGEVLEGQVRTAVEELPLLLSGC